MTTTIKRALSLFLCAALLFCAAPLTTVFAEGDPTSGTCGANLTWTYDTSTKTLTIDGTGEMYDYTSGYSTPPWTPYADSIASVVVGDGVTTICNNAFAYNYDTISTVTFGNSIIKIGRSAFTGCKALTSVTFSNNSLTVIDDFAFSGCTSLTGIVIPDSVTSIGVQVFYDCSTLKTVTIGTNLSKISANAFRNCAALKSITIPNNVTNIEEYAFFGCSALTTAVIGNGVTSIGEGAFSSCDSLNSLTIGSNVETIGNNAFQSCKSLTDVMIPDSVTKIGESSFNGCNNLTSVKIGSNVTNIGSYAFSGCTSLTGIVIPDSVTSIGVQVFYGCSALKTVTIGTNLSKISANAFRNCAALKSITIPNNVTNIEEYAFFGCSALTTAVIGNGVTSIGENAFSSCGKLETITIGHEVGTIGAWAFYLCNKLADVYYQGTRAEWKEITIGNYNDPLLNANIHCLDDLKTYTVSYNANGGSGAPDAQTKTEGTPLTLSSTVPTRSGYTFLGWAESANATTATYQPGDSFTKDADTTLYAVWQKINYTLTYNANGGSGAPVAQTGSGTITLSNTKPTRSGYTFLGWATTASATAAQYAAGASFDLTANTTLYAVWEKIITPTQPQVRKVEVNDVTVNCKSSVKLNPVITADPGADYKIKYESSNEKVAKVDANGNVTGMKKGTATITCTVTDEAGNTVKDTCKVTVKYTFVQWIIVILLFGWLWF